MLTNFVQIEEGVCANFDDKLGMFNSGKSDFGLQSKTNKQLCVDSLSDLIDCVETFLINNFFI
jgi:hypothetical protein